MHIYWNHCCLLNKQFTIEHRRRKRQIKRVKTKMKREKTKYMTSHTTCIINYTHSISFLMSIISIKTDAFKPINIPMSMLSSKCVHSLAPSIAQTFRWYILCVVWWECDEISRRICFDWNWLLFEMELKIWYVYSAHVCVREELSSCVCMCVCWAYIRWNHTDTMTNFEPFTYTNFQFRMSV